MVDTGPDQHCRPIRRDGGAGREFISRSQSRQRADTLSFRRLCSVRAGVTKLGAVCFRERA